MAISVRFRVGLREFQLETDTGVHVGDGLVLAPREALRTLAEVRDPASRAMIRSIAGSFGARRHAWQQELRLGIAMLLETGRLRLRAIESGSVRVLGREQRAELDEREQNQIHETHSVMIELVDADGNPVPGEPFRIKLPDGTVRTLKLDEHGKAHVTGIEQPGTCQVCFHQRDASVWANA